MATPSRLTVVRTACRAFDEQSPLAKEPGLRAYLADMIAPFGVALDEEPITGHSHGDMADPLIDALDLRDPVDVLVLAQRMHDVRPGRATATYLSSRCPGEPLAFAVCDQGTATPFTALRLLDGYARGGACARAVLLVVEQAGLPYPLVSPAPLPSRHTAVGLLLESRPSAGITVRQRVGVSAAAVSDEIASLCADRPDAVVLRGPSAELPLTGLWWELAAGLSDWAGRRVVLADYDPVARLLSVAAIDVGHSQEEG
ncbi:MAG TPA: hypothetical protein VH333_22950 [Pseudonocardiaceae bacterium]|jgi:4-hydroxymandelate oxidase|nr:hypothetical protein [Pseudonocardiaceae bacterium]